MAVVMVELPSKLRGGSLLQARPQLRVRCMRRFGVVILLTDGWKIWFYLNRNYIVFEIQFLTQKKGLHFM